MVEREKFWIDAETGLWLAEDQTWGLVTSGRTKQAAKENLEKVRDLHLRFVQVQ